MTADAKKILEQALALPEAERAVLIEVLADSMLGNDDDVSPEWKAEIARRIEAVERGESRLIPGEAVEARIRETLSRHNRQSRGDERASMDGPNPPPKTPTLQEVLEGAERAQQRVSQWPDWKKELSSFAAR